MDIGTKQRMLEEIDELEMKGSVPEISERFRAYVISQEKLREEMYHDFEIRAKEYIYLIDDYRTAIARWHRRYKRLKISYLTFFIIVMAAVLFYYLIKNYGLFDMIRI